MFGMFKKEKVKIDEALDALEQFREEINESINKFLDRSYKSLDVGSPSSSYAMLFSLGMSDLHVQIVKNAFNVTIDNSDVRRLHLINGAVFYALLACTDEASDFDAKTKEFAVVYREIGYGNVKDENMINIIRQGFEFASLDRAFRESPGDPKIQESLIDGFAAFTNHMRRLQNI